MLKFYETFQKCNVPSSLDGQILNGEAKAIKTIDNINKVNIFIGANNSGKSKILRELLKQDASQYFSDSNWNNITDLLSRFFDITIQKFKGLYATDHFVINNNQTGQIVNLDEIENRKSSSLKYSEKYDLESLITYINNQFILLPANLNRNSPYFLKMQNSETALTGEKVDHFLLILNEIKELAASLIEELKTFQFSSLTKEKISKIYIPSIRTLRKFGSKADIKAATQTEYQFGENIQIYNGQALPEQIFNLNNSKFSIRQKLDHFEELLSKEFFESKKVSLTYEKDQEVLLIKIGDEMERPIHELGDGLQMIIILTFPFYDNASGIILIEEPELFIHPGLQKAFIKFLISNPITENFQIFLATHSNHIIDSINNSELVSLFSVKKKEKPNDSSLEKTPDFIVENLAFGNSNLLSLLGITTTSVYLSNCTIWVEGITDKIYIQHFIAEYLKSVTNESTYFICKKFREGTNYSFALTAGDSIIHWDFAEDSSYQEKANKIIVDKFCSKSMVIVDNDFGKNPLRKNSFKELLGERFIELEVPEIENLLPQAVVNKTILDYPSVARAIGTDILPVLATSDLSEKKIGYIIDHLILRNYSSVKIFSAPGKNTGLKKGDKYDFCIKAIVHLTKGNLTAASERLVEKILDFVISRNT